MPTLERGLLPIARLAAAALLGTCGLAAAACDGLKIAAQPELDGLGDDAASDEPDEGPTAAWVEMAAGATTARAAAIPAPKAPEIIVPAQARPWDLAATSDRIFWTERTTGGGVFSARKDGTDPKSIAPNLDGASEPVAHQDKIYFIRQSPGDGSVMVAPQAGGTVSRLTVADTPSAIATRGNEVFWAEVGSNVTYPVRRRSVTINDTSNLDTYQIAVGGIFVDGSGAYWTTRGCLANCKSAVLRANLTADAGAIAVYSGPAASEMGGITGDASNLYVADSEAGRVLSIPKGGGKPIVLAQNLGYPVKVVLDSGFVYFTDMGSYSANDGSVMRVPTSGKAAPTPIALGQAGPRGLAVDATHVYWTNTRSGEILRVAK